jgi:hypothetical protein
MSRIYIYNNQLILSYSKITGYYLSIRTTGNIPPVNSKIPNTKNHLSIETTQMPSEDPYYYLYSLPDLNLIKQVNHKPKEDYPFLYKDIQTNRDYSFVLDDQSSNLTVYSNQTNQDLREQSHIRDNNRELAQALSNNLAYTINGDYLYLANDQTALEICDLHNAYFFQRTGALAWDWIDRFTSFNSAKEDIYRRFWYRTYHTRSLFVEGNRAVLIQDNGFMVFDISQPEHPRKIAKQTYQPIINWAHDGNRIYIFNRQGMTVFQIP